MQGELYRESIKRKCVEHCDYFTEKILDFKNPAFVREWFKILELPENRQILLLAPRSHGKSTAITVNYALWNILKDRNIRVVIASNTASQAQSFLREISARIEKDKNLISIFGKLKPPVSRLQKWTDSEVIVERDSLSKDATVSAVGCGGAILSRRADLILCDDLIDEENSRTSEQRRKIRDWFYKVLLPVLEPSGQLVVVGTRWNIQDLYSDLIKDPSFDVKRVYKAIVREPERNDLWNTWSELSRKDKAQGEEFLKKNNIEMHKGAVVLYPERWSLVKLMQKKLSSGSLIFAQQYQNVALDDEVAVFKSSWLKYYNPSEVDLSKLTIFGALDPAISEKESADYSVFCTIGIDKDGKIYVLDVDRQRRSIGEQIKTVLNKYQFYKHEKVGIETVAFQRVIKSELDRISQEKRLYVPTTELKADKDKYRRIAALQPYFENGVVFLRDNQDALIDELLQFPQGKHDDAVDALAYAISLIQGEDGRPQLFVIDTNKEPEPEPEEPRKKLFWSKPRMVV